MASDKNSLILGKQRKNQHEHRTHARHETLFDLTKVGVDSHLELEIALPIQQRFTSREGDGRGVSIALNAEHHSLCAQEMIECIGLPVGRIAKKGGIEIRNHPAILSAAICASSSCTVMFSGVCPVARIHAGSARAYASLRYSPRKPCEILYRLPQEMQVNVSGS